MKANIGKIAAALCLFAALCGCAVQKADIPRETNAEAEDISDVLYMDFADYKEQHKKRTKSSCVYYMDENTIPVGRTVEVGYENPFHSKGSLVELTSGGIDVSKEKVFTSSMNFVSTSAVKEITGINSLDKIWEQYGQAMWYIEENETIVLLFEHFQGGDNYYTVFYGSDSAYDTVRIDDTAEFGVPHRPQVTDDKIYIFTQSYDKIFVNAVDRAAQTVEFNTVTYEDMGISDKNLGVSASNIFIDGSVMFLYAEDYGSGGYVSLYDLERGIGANCKVKKDSGDGKLFRYGDGLGLMVSECYNSGYNTTMGIRFFEFEPDDPSIHENEDMYVEIAREAKYSYYIDGHKFYCVGDTLCGMILHINIDTGISDTDAYVEISLPDGAVTTFIPIDINQFNFRSYTIRENGVAVSPHNVN